MKKIILFFIIIDLFLAKFILSGSTENFFLHNCKKPINLIATIGLISTFCFLYGWYREQKDLEDYEKNKEYITGFSCYDHSFSTLIALIREGGKKNNYLHSI